MPNHTLDAEPGNYSVREAVSARDHVSLEVTRGAETWQFFAFVFAAAVTLGLALCDEITDSRWRIAAKVVTFLGVGYLTLVNVLVRGLLVALLGRFKVERR